jgi:hypothetical protein
MCPDDTHSLVWPHLGLSPVKISVSAVLPPFGAILCRYKARCQGAERDEEGKVVIIRRTGFENRSQG